MQAASPHAYGVFISYRRRDTAFPAAWLDDRLVARFGRAHIFKDVDSIAPGEDFVEAITRAVIACHTMLVVIGKNWLAQPIEAPGVVIDYATDFVQLEVETCGFTSGSNVGILADPLEGPPGMSCRWCTPAG